MMTTRRTLLLSGVAALLLPVPAFAADYAIDWQGKAVDPALAARLAHQVALVKASPIRADILAFFSEQPIRVLPKPGEGSRGGPGGVFITRDPFPDDNPVLLHELIHCWHFAKLVNTPRAATLRAAFAAEQAAPHWPRQAYLYTNIAEYLAMTASVVIHGRAARPPFTRAEVRAKLPATYAFIVEEFGVRV